MDKKAITETAAEMIRERTEKRRQERLGAALGVALGKASGVTRDVSASGVFFEIDAAYAVGSRIRFEIDLDTPWGKAICDCSGRIVRVQRRDGRVGIAVKFSDAKPRARPAKALKRALLEQAEERVSGSPRRKGPT